MGWYTAVNLAGSLSFEVMCALCVLCVLRVLRVLRVPRARNHNIGVPLPPEGGLDIVLSTGGYQRQHPSIGGQLVYPKLDNEWESSPELDAALEQALTHTDTTHVPLRTLRTAHVARC